MRPKSTQRDVFNALEGERAYQDAQRGNARTDSLDSNAFGSHLVLIRHYLTLAEVAYSGPHPEGRDKALDIVRKVTALGVRAMELHGAVARS